jgi:hypothetical protein
MILLAPFSVAPHIRPLRLASFAALALLCAAALPARAQAHPTGTETGVTEPVQTPPPLFANTNPTDPNQAKMLHSMEKERNVIRQQQIVDETNQLLDLAKQLKTAVDKSSKDQLSLNVVNTAAEIEKLAKSVKEKMRDGQ